ncbi:MFS transporter [Ornithinimicrobium sp. INDO-MA30-4]|uniref:MFS transporter n=1 Tax=Ornithinimicrobium sp. INDO-MA30-4 TaxID=2908651 RepID=UPI001F1BCC24|nr:MFS transporter [Ornithinimicrobium sp. INDO-MA30-4]UJH71679.1 MFS transporter [Ornithinimicrobium sp. INDO-MA30-4]
MISIMVMTPVHMAHGGAQIEVIGFVISMHIIGMYALSPVVGYLTDRIGSGRVIMLGVAILLAACAFAGLSATGFSINLTAGLVLLGLGWSCTMVAGSAQVSAAVPVGERASAQGASDVVMGLAGASGGALAGVIVAVLGFGYLAALAAGVTLLLGAYTLRHPSHTENQAASLPIK